MKVRPRTALVEETTKMQRKLQQQIPFGDDNQKSNKTCNGRSCGFAEG
jgi:hypothetical protein